jgi:restriction system protein
MTKLPNSEFAQFFPFLIDALRSLGGSASTSEAVDRSLELRGIEEDRISPKEVSRFRNQVNWARLYLVRAGLLDPSSRRGIWQLTDDGYQIDTANYDWVKMFRDVQKQFQAERQQRLPGTASQLVPEISEQQPLEAELDASEVDLPIEEDIDALVLARIMRLPPAGFERLCQRILREADFEKVEVTGKSGDGGIDGIGILRINHFVSFKVLFQCKKYAGSVSSRHVRDFRGAMLGRADKGLILTTGTFTSDAKGEARRDGAPPIELVDGAALVELMKKLQLGVVERTSYEIDGNFFSQFSD